MMLNPRDMKRIMKQLNAKRISAKRVIIERDEGNIVIENPDITQMGVGGNIVFQVMGDIAEQKFKEEDINLIIEKTGKSKEEVRKALEKNNGDIAQTILELSE